MSTTATDTAWYTYGVVSSEQRDGVPATAAGVDLHVVDAAPLAAVTSRVSLDEFGEEPLREHLNDRDWLERHVRLHEDVLLAISADTPIVPFRFGTISHTRNHLCALLRGREDTLLSALERIRGRIEVGVKVWVDEPRLRQALVAPGEPAASPTGRAYLEARRAAQRRAADVEAFSGELARTVYDSVAAHAVDGVVNRPQPRELTGRKERMVLNAAFLVDAGSAAIPAELEALARQLDRFGVTLELTGPWPAHNFVDGKEGAA